MTTPHKNETTTPAAAPSDADARFDIDALLTMAQLDVTDEARVALTGDLQRVVRFVEVLATVDVAGVEPLVHPSAEALTLRRDETTDVLGRAALAKSPHFDGTYVRVPKVIG